jgi:transcriptional regulator with XRE-family HTH domain
MPKELKLTVGELISIFRNRKGMTQAELGEIVFKDLQSPNVKVKKIEKDQQRPTNEDVIQIAKALDVEPEFIMQSKLYVIPSEKDRRREGYEYRISGKVKLACPNFSTYLQAINSMAKVDDIEIMMIILKKMCKEILSGSCINKKSNKNNNDNTHKV